VSFETRGLLFLLAHDELLTKKPQYAKFMSRNKIFKNIPAHGELKIRRKKEEEIMIWPILLAIIAVIVWIRYRKSSDDPAGPAMFIFVGVMLGLLIGVLAGNFIPKYKVVSNTVKIVSLRNGDGITGSFFLGSGSIGSEQYYFYYKKVGNGYQQGKLMADDKVTVFEEERKDGEIRIYVSNFVSKSYFWVAFPVCMFEPKYEFHIPNGSLKMNFTLQ